MTDSRINDIENAILVGLIEASENGEKPFKIDEQIFKDPLKKRLVLTINKYIDSEEPELIQYRIMNAIDNTPVLQNKWIEINEKTTNILSVSVIKRYYDDLVTEHNNRILRGGI